MMTACSYSFDELCPTLTNLFIVDEVPLTYRKYISQQQRVSEWIDEEEKEEGKKAFKIHDTQVMWHKIASNHIIICVSFTN